MNKKELALMIGASSDIGTEIIRQLSSVSVRILAVDISVEKIEQLKEGLAAEITALKADISDEKQLAGLIEQINRQGVPDKVIFLAAPKMAYIRFKDLEWDEMRRNIDVQIKAPFQILKALLPQMAKAGKGKVLFLISSVVLNVPPKFLMHYTITKHALLGMMKSLAAEYADKGININAISPSMTETGFLSGIPEKTVELAAMAHPLKRNAVPKDIAPLARFLLSDEAGYINGINVPVCGGSIF